METNIPIGLPGLCFLYKTEPRETYWILVVYGNQNSNRSPWAVFCIQNRAQGDLLDFGGVWEQTKIPMGLPGLCFVYKTEPRETDWTLVVYGNQNSNRSPLAVFCMQNRAQGDLLDFGGVWKPNFQ